MRRAILASALLLMIGAATAVTAKTMDIKLPKCSMKMCRDTGCSPETLCVSGAHVKNCADVCNGN